ncbi:MAG TPA: 7TM-DISM domain-containing protein [Spirochaetota bacterium]|nr:7TM-DISM domain-containing protein [Spirochaetota bacterium]
MTGNVRWAAFRFFLIIATGCLLRTAGSAQVPAVIDGPDFERINITPVLEYYEDRGRMQGVQDVAEADGWKKCGTDYINFGYSESAYWFRFKLENKTDALIEGLLELNYPHLDFIDFFEMQGKQFRLHRKTGDGYPFHMRDICNRSFVFKLALSAGTTYWFFRTYNNGPFKFKCTLYSTDDFIRHINLTSPFYWLYYGVFCIMAILSMFIFIRMRSLPYLFLSLFILSLALINFHLNGFSFQYLWPRAVWWNRVNTFAIWSSVMVFLSLFVMSITGRFRGSFVIKKIITPLVVAPGIILGLLFAKADASFLYRAIYTIWVVIAVIAMFLGTLWGSLQGDRPSRYILFSFTLFFAGILVYSLMDFSFIPYSDLTEWSLQLGSVMMILAITFGLAGDMKKSRDELEANEKRLSNILFTTREGFAEMDESHFIRDVNPALCDMLGRSREEIIGKPVHDFIRTNDAPVLDAQVDLRRRGVSSSYEFDIISSDGSPIHVLISSNPVVDGRGHVAGAISMVSDITELKKREQMIRHQRDEIQAAYEELEATNEELTASNEEFEAMNEELLKAQSELLENEKLLKAGLNEKDLLLKEIHHRVKNNMQVVTSLLHLQSDFIFDERDRELFVETENRVRSMALVHQKIYQSPDLSRVDFGEYISDVVEDLFFVYSVNKELISTLINVSDIYLGVDLAIPCALIINEAVTNSIKHAFPEGRKGVIGIDFIRGDDGLYSLTIKDDGIGLGDDALGARMGSLGMDLIKGLAVQIKGKLDVLSESGTSIRIVFPPSRVSA